MEYREIQDKELKTILHLLTIIQNTRALLPNETKLLDALKVSFPIISEERSVIYHYAKEHNLINAPESYPSDRGGICVLPIDSPYVSKDIVLTENGKKEFEKLFSFADNWLQNKLASERIEALQNQFLEAQIESIKFANKTAQETIRIAKSAKWAAWASAICAFFTVILVFLEFLKTIGVL